MSNAARRRGVVKQLSNLSIDEVSLVDRGANQHALVALSKRYAPAVEADDFFEDVEKKNPVREARRADNKAFKNEVKGSEEWKTGNKQSARALGLYGAAGTGAAIASAVKNPKGKLAAAAASGGALATGITQDYKGQKNRDNAIINGHNKRRNGLVTTAKALSADDYFEKKGGSKETVEQFSGSDLAGVTDYDDDNEIGPNRPEMGGKEKIKGQDTPPQKKKQKGRAGSSDEELNPGKLSGLGKSESFWMDVITKALDEADDLDDGQLEFETDDDYDDDDDVVGKHFPGSGNQASNPMASPFPGATGMGQPPTMQTTGVQPMGMGQPTPPPMGGQPGADPAAMGGGAPQQPGGGMPQQLPPDVVQYIQQLEQALEEANGGSSEDPTDDASGSDSAPSGSSDGQKKNPFGKSGDFDMDENTFLTELAKSLDGEDQREAVSKAMEAVSKAEQRAQAAENVAKAERDLRLEREFIAKAAEFDVPVSPRELGPVLKRMAESLDREDFAVIVKCLDGASAQQSIFSEVGKRGGGDNLDILDEVSARAQEFVGKNFSQEEAVAEVLALNPRAYDEYMASHPARRH